MDDEEELDDITMSQAQDINDEQKDVDDNMDFEDDDNDGFEDDDNDGFNDGSEDDWGDDADNDGWGDADDIALGGDDAIQAGKTVESIKISIPERTIHDIHSNVDEINMLPMFAAAADLKSRSRIGAIVAIKVDRLTNITQDQLEVWGLTPEYPYIALVFEFGVSYLHELQPPKMKCGISKELSASADLKAFRLSWTIKERCNNSLLNTSHWPSDIQEQNIPIPDAHKIAELMESSQQEYALVWEALQKCHNSVDEALNMMLDESNVQKLRKRLPSITVCNAEFHEIMSKISTKSDADHALHLKENWKQNYQKADIISQIEHISQMFSMPNTAAALIINDVGYDTAVAQLEDPEVVQNYITRVENGEEPNISTNDNCNNNNTNVFGKVWKTITGNKSSNNSEEDLKIDSEIGDMQSLVRISSSGGKIRQILSENVMRSIVVMSRHNFLLRVLCYALKILLNGNKYCMICDKELVFAGLKPTICSAVFCQFRHDQIGLGFSLAAEITNRADIVDLLLSMCYSACNAGRISFFFPSGVRGLDAETASESFLLGDVSAFDSVKFAANEDGQPKPDIQKLKLVMDMCPAINDLKEYAHEGDVVLKKYLTSIHCLLYPLLAWIVTSNRCHLRRLSEEQRIKSFDTEWQFALCAQTPEKEAEFQRLQKQNGSFLAFHGSPMGNWHSILRMGLRNYSKTKHQSNGAAYGSGIYFGKNFSLSWNYCKPGTNPSWVKSRYGSNMSCMALCEICYHTDDAHHHKDDVNAVKDGENVAQTANFGTRETNAKNRWVKTSQIYVVDDEECVTTRFFLIFEKTSGYKNIQANSVDIPQVVQRSAI